MSVFAQRLTWSCKRCCKLQGHQKDKMKRMKTENIKTGLGGKEEGGGGATKWDVLVLAQEICA